MPNLKKGWDAKNESPKSHVSFTPQELNEYQSVQQNQTNLKAMANAWKPEKYWAQMEMEHKHKAQV